MTRQPYPSRGAAVCGLVGVGRQPYMGVFVRRLARPAESTS
jgi:hypothetical protein